MSEIEEAARNYIKQGWVPIALGLDSDGRPKKPLAEGWPNLTLDNPDVRKQGWAQAKGVGVACGPQSNNLAVIDIDDPDLALEVWWKFQRSKKDFRWVWTIRKRGHLYFYEETPSVGRFIKCLWKGKEIKIELKCQGQQVAAPGTPGYVLARDVPPQTVPDVGAAFSAICLAVGIEPTPSNGGANYPESWQEVVGEGDRNNALFLEAARLASVKMPFERAVEILTTNIERHYAGGFEKSKGGLDYGDCVATIRSAYRRAWPKVAGPAENERYRREIR